MGRPFERFLYRGVKPAGGRAFASDPGDFGRGIYWTSVKAQAKAYGPEIRRERVRLDNPLRLTATQAYDLAARNYGKFPRGDEGVMLIRAEAMTRDLLVQGHDGLVVMHRHSGRLEVVDFRPYRKM